MNLIDETKEHCKYEREIIASTVSHSLEVHIEANNNHVNVCMILPLLSTKFHLGDFSSETPRIRTNQFFLLSAREVPWFH